MVVLSEPEWNQRGEQLFGADRMTWRFVCPACRHVASVADWKAVGAPEASVAFSCVGRWLPTSREAFADKPAGPGPCNYAGGGLFRLNPVHVERTGGVVSTVFAFDESARAAT